MGGVEALLTRIEKPSFPTPNYQPPLTLLYSYTLLSLCTHLRSTVLQPLPVHIVALPLSPSSNHVLGGPSPRDLTVYCEHFGGERGVGPELGELELPVVGGGDAPLEGDKGRRGGNNRWLE